MKRYLFIVALLLGNAFASIAQNIGTEPGNIAPEISLPSPAGNVLELSSLKGKLVLVDFWGTWCSPCMEEQHDLLRLYKKYKKVRFTNGEGFEIYGVSLDAKKANWESTIAALQINWIQVSDLKYWRSPVAKTYKIEALPFNLLIDGKGIVLAKNLHGTDLEKAISKQIIK